MQNVQDSEIIVLCSHIEGKLAVKIDDIRSPELMLAIVLEPHRIIDQRAFDEFGVFEVSPLDRLKIPFQETQLVYLLFERVNGSDLF